MLVRNMLSHCLWAFFLQAQATVTAEGSFEVCFFATVRTSDPLSKGVHAWRVAHHPQIIFIDVPMTCLRADHPNVALRVFEPKFGDFFTELFWFYRARAQFNF
jgi:hypothetical protein